MIPTVTIEEALEKMDKPDFRFHIVRVKAGLDIDFYKDLVKQAEKIKPLIAKDGFDTYESLSLQYRDVENKYYDGTDFNALNDGSVMSAKMDGYIDRSIKNEIGELFKPWFDYLDENLNGLHVYRTRILRTTPGHNAPMHIDESDSSRVHLPLETDRFNIMYFGNTPYHMRADGSIYFCNTGSLSHSFHNFSGKTTRTHLVSCLVKGERRVG